MAHKFNDLNIDLYTRNKFWRYNHKIQLHDISKLFKLEPLTIKGIYLTEVYMEIKQTNITYKIRNRYPGIDIFSKENYRVWT